MIEKTASHLAPGDVLSGSRQTVLSTPVRLEDGRYYVSLRTESGTERVGLFSGRTVFRLAPAGVQS